MLGLSRLVSPHCVSASFTYSSEHVKAKFMRGPLLGRSLGGSSSAKESKKQGRRPSSFHAARADFSRLPGESSRGIANEGAPKGREAAWTSPDLAADNELFSIAPTKSLHSVNTTSRKGGQ